MLVHPENFHQLIIDQAFENEDSQTVIDAYLDCLDYRVLDDSVYVKVLDSLSFDEQIDHVLVGHVKENMDRCGLDARLHMSAFYLHAKGGLTAADLLNELANDPKVEKVQNSNLFKTNFVDTLQSEDFQLDNFVREKVTEAFEALKPKLDAEFYGLAAETAEEEVVPEEAASEEPTEKQAE